MLAGRRGNKMLRFYDGVGDGISAKRRARRQEIAGRLYHPHAPRAGLLRDALHRSPPRGPVLPSQIDGLRAWIDASFDPLIVNPSSIGRTPPSCPSRAVDRRAATAAGDFGSRCLGRPHGRAQFTADDAVGWTGSLREVLARGAACCDATGSPAASCMTANSVST